MGLLLPAALALGLLVAGPLLAHLARQDPGERIAFGAIMLLRRLERTVERRRRLRDRLLMALRMLLVFLVALAAARPELRWPGAIPELGGTGAVVIVLDQSLSMDLRRGDRTAFAEAREQAAAIVRGLPPGALVGAVTIGGQAELLTPRLTPDTAAVAQLLEDVGQSQGRTDLVGGLRHARRLLGGKGGEVVVFTDEAGPTAVPESLEEVALLVEQGAALVPRPLRVPDPENLAVVGAVYGDGVEGGSVRVTVANFGTRRVEAPVTVRLPGGTDITAFVDVEPGARAEALVTVPRAAEGGVGLASVEDPALEADNTFAFHLPQVGASRVLVVDGDPGVTSVASEVYFLERALAPWGAGAAARGGVLPDVTASTGIPELDPSVHRVVFLANVADPGPVAHRLLEFVRQGGGLVIGLGDNVTAERYNQSLAPLLPAPLRKVRGLSLDDGGAPLALPDTALPLFEPFARGGRAAFGQVLFKTLMTLDPYEESDAVKTLLRTQDGLPVLVERTVGQGRVLLYTGTFDLGWGNLPLQAISMPLVQRIVRYLGGEAGGAGERLQGRVGEPVRVALPTVGVALEVVGPDGPVAHAVESGFVSFVPRKAGAYRVETPGAPPLGFVAVNVDEVESDVRPGPALAESAATIDPDRFLHREPLHLWLLAAALGGSLLVAWIARGRNDA